MSSAPIFLNSECDLAWFHGLGFVTGTYRSVVLYPYDGACVRIALFLRAEPVFLERPDRLTILTQEGARGLHQAVNARFNLWPAHPAIRDTTVKFWEAR